MATLTFFTDGSCRGNGTARARATYGVVELRAGGGLAEAARGRVAPFEYRLAGGALEPAAAAARPSNNRGEYLAAARALQQAVARGAAECHIVSDSNILVQTFLDWLPKRKAKGTAAQLKNYDLVQAIDALSRQVRVKWEHVRGHQKAVRRADYADTPEGAAMYRWAVTCKAGNDAADAAANAAHDDPEAPPAPLEARLARLEARLAAQAARLDACAV